MFKAFTTDPGERAILWFFEGSMVFSLFYVFPSVLGSTFIGGGFSPGSGGLGCHRSGYMITGIGDLRVELRRRAMFAPC